MQELSNDQVGDLIVDRRAQEDDSLVEQAAVDVKRALPAGGLLDDHRYQWAHVLASFASCAGILPTVAMSLPAATMRAAHTSMAVHTGISMRRTPCKRRLCERAPGVDAGRLSLRASRACPMWRAHP